MGRTTAVQTFQPESSSRLLDELTDPRYPATAPKRAGRRWGMKLTRAVSAFVEDKKLAKSPATARAYEGDLSYVTKHARRDSVEEFNEALLTTVFGALKQRNLSGNSLFRKATAYREFGKWGVQQGLWAKNPMLDPKFSFRLRRGLPRPFEDAELARLMALQLLPVQHVVRALLYWTGLRVTPITKLRVDDVSFSPMKLETPQGVLEAAGTVRSLNKGEREQLTPMGAELAEILAAWLRDHPRKGYDPLVSHDNGRHLRAETVQRWNRRWGELARVSNAHPHRWRHSFATSMLQKGAGIEVIQRALGHVSIATTMTYARVSDAALLKAILAR